MSSRERLRVLLALADTDQTVVAKSAGISPSTLSRALKGERHLSAETHRRVVEAVVQAFLVASPA